MIGVDQHVGPPLEHPPPTALCPSSGSEESRPLHGCRSASASSSNRWCGNLEQVPPLAAVGPVICPSVVVVIFFLRHLSARGRNDAMVRIAINGLGRIGRATLKIVMDMRIGRAATLLHLMETAKSTPSQRPPSDQLNVKSTLSPMRRSTV